MSTGLQQWTFALALLIVSGCLEVESKIFERCELAKLLRNHHRLELKEVAQWVCIAQHSSGFNTAAQAYSPTGGSHGLFQISDVYWCSPPGQGAGCNLPCHKLRDDNLSDDVSCVKRIYNEHQRISGDGYTAWNAYQQFCKNNANSYIQDCFPGEHIGSVYYKPNKGYNTYQGQYSANAIQDYNPKKSGKVYGRCELARELYQKHKMPMQQIPTWVCIAEHESRFNTAAVGRLNADGSADHGLFQISDLYWCSHDRFSAGKACGLSCNKLLDDDITDDVRCIKRIHNEHTAISGDGFNAWTVYKPYCQNQRFEQIASCFKNIQHTQHKQHTTAVTLATNQAYSTTKYAISSSNPFLKNVVQQTASKTHHTPSSYNEISKTPSRGVSHKKGKVYTRCSLAQELYFKHNFPMQDISTWVCIAEHESQFNTAAIGRLNTDGSADHGLFQISDRYWCDHSAYGGKACNLPCDKLLDDDLRDDVACIRTIHEEHTRISGDGFNAWTVYRPHCQNQNIRHISTCFDEETLQTIEEHQAAPSYNVEAIKGKGKIYTKCELAQELYHKHHMPMEQIPKWVCIAQHESSFNTAAVGRLNTDGSADHGLFQISDLYWCSHDQYGGKACNIPCHKLLDSDITDDVRCIKIIYEEHTRISGDGFNAWTVYQPHCRNTGMDHIKQCFTEKELKQVPNKISPSNSNSLVPQSFGGSKTVAKGKIYKKCELAQELYHKHHMPMEQIPKWVCIAQHESSFNTAAVGRLNADGSADHGLFQISDLYWCSHDQYGGKACNIPCHKLLDSDITDDVRCIKIIYEEHTRISGDGFNAWTVYKPHCRNTGINHVQDCFTDKELKEVKTDTLIPQTSYSSKPASKGKIYKKCELAQELYHKHHMPMEQIPKWVCIAQHESSFNTAAVGRLNTDGSVDHGLFQISDLYWCTHDQYGGKACNIPCDKLLDSDITDDVKCIKIIYEEHTRISGDGFNAWTVYKPHCRNTGINHVQDCFTDKELKDVKTGTSNALIPQTSFNTKPVPKGKIYKKCELAQELYHKHRMPMEQIPKWVCIAQHESSFNTAAVGRLNADGSADHGLFQISDLYWCSHDQYGGKACNIPCHKLLDSDITDDVRCIKIIYEEHTRISGDGFNAWTVYKPHCRNTDMNHIRECFSEKELKQTQTTGSSNALIPQTTYNTKSIPKGKIYKKCELAQELYHKHHMPMEQIPKWVCIAQHESSYNTAAVGRLNTDGSADHGLFQISDLYWCTHDQYGGKACNIPCDKLLDSDITDDVRCIKIIHEEHTRISGDGFNAWTVYKPHCRNTGMNHIQECFTEKELKEANVYNTAVTTNFIQPQYTTTTKNVGKGKIYKKCELAQELLSKHKMPMEQIPTWVCIAQHESSFNTAAVGRLNADGSADHGLFQISDLYWCSHDQYGGKACNIPCDKLLDSDITDDVRCIKIIYEEHTRISGDGFNAWTVYKPHCRNRKMEEIRSCFTPNQIEDYEKTQKYSNKVSSLPTLQKVPPKSSYSHNPFLNGGLKTQTSTNNFKDSSPQEFNEKPNYANNPFLQNIQVASSTQVHKTTTQLLANTLQSTTTKPNYKDNPFLNGAFSSSNNKNIISKPIEKISNKDSYQNNPFLSNIKLTTTNKPIQTSGQYNPFVQTTPVYKTEITKNYLNSNDFRTTTTPKPKTTVAKPITITTTTRKPTSTSKKPITTTTKSSSQRITTTTKKPITTTTKKSVTTTKSTTKSPKTTTTWSWQNQKHQSSSTITTTKKPLTTSWTTTRAPKTTTTWSWQNQKLDKTTTKAPKTTTTWNWQNQKYQSSITTTTKKPAATTRTTTKSPKTSTTWNWQNPTITTTKKPITTTKTTTKSPKTTTTWSWQNQKSTTKAPKTSTTWNWQNQKYANATTTVAPKTTTTWNWQNQKYQNPTTTKSPKITSSWTTTTTKSPKTTTSWNWQNQRYTNNSTLGQTTKTPQTTTVKTIKTTWNWRNEQKSTTTKPLSTTTNWQKWDKTTTKKPSTTSTITTRKSTTKPTTSTTLRPRSTTTQSLQQKTGITTTRKPLTTKSSINSVNNQYKNDPFSHPFFAKVNEQIKQLKANVSTTKIPNFAATKLQSFPQSQLYQDFKNSTLNKTKTIVSYNFEGSKLTTTKRPRF